jgi:type I restriction enzyme S subunit
MPKENVASGVLFVKVKDIKGDKIDLHSLHRTTQEIAQKYARASLKAGDLLLSIRGTYGRVAEVPPELDGGNITQDTARLDVTELADHRYVAMCLRSPHCQNYFKKVARGVAVKGVNIGDVRLTPIPLPPLNEQRQVVAEIEKQFTRLEAGVTALRRVQANLKRYRAAVLKAACEGRLVPTEAELAKNGKSKAPFESGKALLARILTERRKNWQGRGQYKDPAAPAATVQTRIPEGWALCTVDQIAECLDGRRVPINKTERAKRQGEIPYYGANGQVGWIDSHIFDEPLVLVVEDETFTGRTQAFSYVIHGKTWVNNHAHVLRSTHAVSTAYLNYSLAHYPFIPLTTGSTGRRKLTQKALMTAPYWLPPIAEQTRIVAEVDRRLSVVDELEAVVSVNLQRGTRLRQSILQQAFTGALSR